MNCGDRIYLMDSWARFGIYDHDSINIWTRWEFFFARVYFILFWVGILCDLNINTHTHTHTHTEVFGEGPFNISFLLFQYVYVRVAEKISTYTHICIVHRKNDLPAPSLNWVRPNMFISERFFFLINVSHLPNFVRGRKPIYLFPIIFLESPSFSNKFLWSSYLQRGGFFFFFWWYNTELDRNFLCPYCDNQSHPSQALDMRRLHTSRKHRSIPAKIASLPSPDRPLRGTVWGS